MNRLIGIPVALGVTLLLGSVIPAAIAARTVRPADVVINGAFTIEAAVTGLAAPTMVAFDDQGRMLIAESGYDGGGTARVTRVEADGSRTTLATIAPAELPLTAVAFHDGAMYFVTATTVWRLDDGGPTALIDRLPGLGDHQPNQLVFSGNRMYLGVGTVTNSGVVGPDNAIFGWLEMPERRTVHDIPCEDVEIAGAPFTSADPFGVATSVQTSPYAPFGTVLPAGTVVPGDVRCNGAILSAALDGSDLRVEAWGLRNPYGLELAADGSLYFTMHGDDARGSRQIENAPDCLYRLEPGAWYGWPDFACDRPVTEADFKPANQPQPGFILARHPTDSPPAPVTEFAPHAAANGFAFSIGGAWGPATDAFVALFGDSTPATGTVARPQGVTVVRVDTTTGATSPFIGNVIAGEASEHGLGGLEHPSDVTFGPDGAMYIADWGIFRDSLDGLKLDPDSGVVWRVLPAPASGAAAPLGVIFNMAIIAVLAVLTVLVLAGPRRVLSLGRGIAAGLAGAIAMGAFAMFVASPILQLPWFGTPRVLATVLLGRTAVQNIVEFEPVSFAVGSAVLLALGASTGLAFALLARTGTAFRIIGGGLLFGLTTWAAAQWFVLPLLFPLISDKGLPPIWLAASLALLGSVIGLAGAALARRRGTA